MKVLIVNTVPFNKNGISSVIMNYYNALKNDLDIQFDFLSISDFDEDFQKMINDNTNVYIIKNRKRNPLTYCLNLYKLLKKNQYDIIHLHGNSALLSLELVTAKLAKVPTRIAHSHNTTCDYKLLNKVLKPIFFKSYTHGIACGTEAGKWMFGNHEFIVLENGINLETFSFNALKRAELRKKLGLENKIVIGHVGGFVTQKNHTLLIDQFKELLSNNDNYHLLLIGDGPLKKDIENKCIELNLENSVTFLGNKQDVYNYYNAMDIFILPSLFEGLPVVLIEAQANGLPCIVADTVSQEAKLSNLIDFVSNNQYVISIEGVCKKKNIDQRKNESKEVIIQLTKKGFNVIENSKKLKSFYERNN